MMFKRYLLRNTNAVILFGALLVSAPVFAHWTHSGSLGSTSTATDILKYSCAATWINPNDNITYNLASFQARVRDVSPVATPYVKVKVERVSPLLTGSLQTDPNSNSGVGDGDAPGKASPFSTVATTAGDTRVYKIYVSKTGSPIEKYQLEYHCLYSNPGSGSFHPTPGVLTYIQNQ